MACHVPRLAQRLKQLATLLWFTVILLAWFAPAQAASQTITEESDWYFTVEDDATLATIYGNSNADCSQVGADPYLWLYDSNNTLIAQDDDSTRPVVPVVVCEIILLPFSNSILPLL